ncbi:MAG: glycosyltransferase family 2 protein, partial [Actinomycetota bacterium]|nr:glycosyltransferase family 2 protein [Actinomycetota bacterium]
MPAIAVVVASHERPLRLRWLLNALQEQELDRARWEVVVCFDDAGEETARLLATHPLALTGVLRALRLPAGTGSAARQRNAGWRAAEAPLVAFTDDDCRPPVTWLAGALAAASEYPGAIIQGTTRPDPAEAHLVAAPHARTQHIEPPVPWAQTCNVIYPRALLEATGGFDEMLTAGEDTELALRARRAFGAAYAGAPGVLTYHCVETGGLLGKLRSIPRWAGLAGVVKAHAGVRRHLVLGVFWRRSHALLALGALGLAAG